MELDLAIVSYNTKSLRNDKPNSTYREPEACAPGTRRTGRQEEARTGESAGDHVFSDGWHMEYVKNYNSVITESNQPHFTRAGDISLRKVSG